MLISLDNVDQMEVSVWEGECVNAKGDERANVWGVACLFLEQNYETYLLKP